MRASCRIGGRGKETLTPCGLSSQRSFFNFCNFLRRPFNFQKVFSTASIKGFSGGEVGGGSPSGRKYPMSLRLNSAQASTVVERLAISCLKSLTIFVFFELNSRTCFLLMGSLILDDIGNMWFVDLHAQSQLSTVRRTAVTEAFG
jgi:hypothetical protein